MAPGLPSSVTESVAKRTTTLLGAARFAAPAAPEGVEQRDELGRLAGLAQVVIKTEVLGQALLGPLFPGAGNRDEHVMALVAQDRGEDLGGVAVVVGHEYTQPHGLGRHGAERTLKPGALLRRRLLSRRSRRDRRASAG